VVPEGAGWTVDPFGGEIIDHKIFGRGAVDDKGPLIAVFYACCAIKDSGLPLKKKIKQIIGTNEEKGVFPLYEIL
jgi:succinyl-diaminopimelate desuccinylase